MSDYFLSFIQNSILYFLIFGFLFEGSWLLRNAAAHHHLHHGGHHVFGFSSCKSSHSSFGMLVSAVLPGAGKAKFALDLRMQINTLFAVGASWEIFAVFTRVDIRTVLRRILAIGKMPAPHVLFACGSWTWADLSFLF